MQAFSSAYNKKQNQFNQGISQIRNKNNHFFENAVARNTIYDLKDIKSYFDIVYSMGHTVLQFRKNSGLPPRIREDIATLFANIWPGEEIVER